MESPSASLPAKPDWIRVRAPSGEAWKRVDEVLARRRLHTVCDEARCPNKGECWGAGTATFMILGDLCTRSCRFCAVGTAREGRPVREDEGEEIARAAQELALDYVVLTSVDRDDLPDRGSGHFARCIAAVKDKNPACQVEALIPDYHGGELERVILAGPEVIAHNVETVRSLQGKVRDSRADFDQSLRTLREIAGSPARSRAPGKPLVKSSILLGLGETEGELFAAMDELREAGVDILVLGQYLRPSPRQLPVSAYISPEDFNRRGEAARRKGFSSVIAAPLARTSYHAKTSCAQARTL